MTSGAGRFLVAAVLAALVAAACAPTAIPSPTTTPTPTRAIEYPLAGKAVTMIVPFAAGGSTDVSARVLAAALEKELGVPVQVSNRAGAGTVLGMTEMVQANPDGYTVAFSAMPTLLNAYLDPQSQATFGRKDLALVARVTTDPGVISVQGSSSIKTLKDLVDSAKATPDKVTVGVTAGLGISQITVGLLAKDAGVKFAFVQFPSGAPALTALLGGQVNAGYNQLSEVLSHVKSGAIRILAVVDKQESAFAPGVPTMESLGYRVALASSHVVVVRSETPAGIVAALSDAIRRAMSSEEYKTRIAPTNLAVRYLAGQDLAAFWTEMEATVGPLMRELRP